MFIHWHGKSHTLWGPGLAKLKKAMSELKLFYPSVLSQSYSTLASQQNRLVSTLQFIHKEQAQPLHYNHVKQDPNGTIGGYTATSYRLAKLVVH